MLNSSLKSELTNIFTFYAVSVGDEFPSSIEPGCGVLCLPERYVERAVEVLKFAESLGCVAAVHA